MRIGLFLHQVPSDFNINELTANLGSELIGYSSPLPIVSLPKNLEFQPHPMELLVCCDVAMIYGSHPVFDEIPRAALRRGINIFFGDLASFSIDNLFEIQHLAQEIGAKVGFGFSGRKVDEINQLADKNLAIMFLQITRKLSKDRGFEELRRSVVYDLATIARIKNLIVKKSKSIVLPNSNCEYNLINASFEMTNGSMLVYTADRLSSQNMVKYSMCGNGMEEIIDVVIDQDDKKFIMESLSSPMAFVDSIKSGSESDFSIEMAIDTFRHLHEISQKHIRLY